MFTRSTIASAIILVLGGSSFAEVSYYYRHSTATMGTGAGGNIGGSEPQQDILLNISDVNVGQSLNGVQAQVAHHTGNVEWSMTGRLPDGVVFTDDGVFNGSPTEAGIYSFTLSASSGGGNLASKSFSFRVNGQIDFEGHHWVHNVHEQDPVLGLPFMGGVSGGVEPYNYTVIDGAYPQGYTLQAVQDAFVLYSFVPAPVGDYPFTLRVVDGNGSSATADFSIKLEEQPYILADFPAGYVGDPYSGRFIMQGVEPGDYVLSTSSDIAGLSWSDGVLSGVPTETSRNAFVYPNLTFPVSASAEVQGATLSSTQQITIYERVSIRDDRGLVPDDLLEYGQPANGISLPTLQFLAVGGAPGTKRFEVIDRGNLPEDFNFMNNGRATRAIPLGGPYNFSVRAYDSNVDYPYSGNEEVRNFTVFVYEAVRIGGGWAFSGTRVGEDVNFTAPVSGGKPSYRWEVLGSLPPGLVLDPDTGLISGSPSQAGTYTFTLRVEDAMGFSYRRIYSDLIIAP